MVARVKQDVTGDNIDYRLLNRLSNLVICSSCLRRGLITPVPQVISDRHSLTNECPNCRDENVRTISKCRKLGKLLTLPQRCHNKGDG